jgi:hypothetical protein
LNRQLENTNLSATRRSLPSIKKTSTSPIIIQNSSNTVQRDCLLLQDQNDDFQQEDKENCTCEKEDIEVDKPINNDDIDEEKVELILKRYINEDYQCYAAFEEIKQYFYRKETVEHKQQE